MKGRRGTGLLLGLAISLAAQADEVRLVTGDDYAPLTSRSLTGAGLLTEVVRAAFAQSGVQASLAWQPWNRGYLMTLEGDYDATFPYIRATWREKDFFYSAPLYLSEQHLFSRAGEPVEPGDLARMSGWRLCQPLGWQLPAPVQALVSRGMLKRHSPPGLGECAQLLLLGRDDLFLADRRLGEFALHSTGASPARFHVSSAVVGRETMHLIVPRRQPGGEALIKRFDSGLQALRTSGAYQRLIDSFASVEPDGPGPLASDAR